MLYSIFNPIFRSIFKPIFNSKSSNNPPDYGNLISWTFADLFNPTFSKDRVTASDEPARFVSSFCYKASNGGEQLYYDGAFPALGLDDMSMEWEMKMPASPALFDGSIGLTTTGARRLGLIVDTGSLYIVMSNAAGSADLVAKGVSVATLGVNDNNWHKYKLNIVRSGNLTLSIDDVVISGYTTDISSQQANSYGAWLGKFRIGAYGSNYSEVLGSGTTSYRNVQVTIGTVSMHWPLQGSGYNIVGSGYHLTKGNAVLDYQDDYHYNLLNGFDKYSEDGSSPVEYRYVPYVNGVPVVSSISGYTKVSSHPAGKWHNGAETKIVVGTNGTKDTNGWQAVTTVKDKLGNVIAIADADPQNVFVNTTTGYCYEIDVNTLPAVVVQNTWEYIFLDRKTTNKYKNLLWYNGANPPTYMNSVKALRFVNKTDFVYDENNNYTFDENGFVLTES